MFETSCLFFWAPFQAQACSLVGKFGLDGPYLWKVDYGVVDFALGRDFFSCGHTRERFFPIWFYTPRFNFR